MRRCTEGFAVLAVLGLLALIGLAAAASLQESLFAQALATARRQQLRAWELSDSGVAAVVERLATADLVGDYADELRPTATAAESVTVSLRRLDGGAPVAGFSVGRFVTERYEIASEGHAARNSLARQVQGVVRVRPAAMGGEP
jgi:type II secretory pathway component PulK